MRFFVDENIEISSSHTDILSSLLSSERLSLTNELNKLIHLHKNTKKILLMHLQFL